MSSWDAPIIEREFQRGKIVFASPESLKPILLDVTKIATWGSKAISCCVIANGLDSCQVGVARRSVLGPNSGRLAHRVVSETLVAVRNSPLKTFVTFSLTERLLQKKVSHTEVLKEEQAALLKKAGGGGVAHENSDDNKLQQQQQQQARRAPPPNPSDAVPGALYMDTTLSLCPVDSDPQKSFVEVFVEYAAADATKADEIAFFLEKAWVGPLLDSLADYALNISFPVQKGPTDLQFRKLYERHEDTVVKICAKKHIDDELKERSEALLDALYASYRDTVAAQTQTENMKNELYSTQLLLREATQKNAQLESELHTVQGKLLIAEHAGTNPIASGNNNNHNNNNNNEDETTTNNKFSVAIASTNTEQNNTNQQQTQTTIQQQKDTRAIKISNSAAADAKSGFTASPEQRSRQVLSAIPDFGDRGLPSASSASKTYKLFNTTGIHAIAAAGGKKIDTRDAEEAALRAKFDSLDSDHNGYLTVDHVVMLLAAIDPSDSFDVQERLERERKVVSPRRHGLQASAVKAELENPNRNPKEAMHYRSGMDWCHKHCRDRSGKKVTFEEFALLMCQLERAI